VAVRDGVRHVSSVSNATRPPTSQIVTTEYINHYSHVTRVAHVTTTTTT